MAHSKAQGAGDVGGIWGFRKFGDPLYRHQIVGFVFNEDPDKVLVPRMSEAPIWFGATCRVWWRRRRNKCGLRAARDLAFLKAVQVLSIEKHPEAL